MNGSRGWTRNDDLPNGDYPVSPEIRVTMMISKKEKRTKKERSQRRGKSFGTFMGSQLFPPILLNNRTSLTAYQEDLFNCP